MTTPRIRLSQKEHAAVLECRRDGYELDRLVSDAATNKNMSIESDPAKGTCKIELNSSIRTVEHALAHAEVDEKVWEVERSVINSYQMGYKDADGNARTRDLWQIKLWLRRKARKGLTDALEAIHERAAAFSPTYTPRLYEEREGASYQYVVELPDMHFGKLAWAKETGNDYDLHIAETIYQNAICELIHRVDHMKIARVLFPIGNDFLHVDGKTLMTEKGTSMGAATEGRYAKIVETGFMALVNAIEELCVIAPVDVVFVQGNHDATSTYHLARELQAWYRKCPNVTVDCGPAPRKADEWGTNLLLFTHGNEETIQRLINIMPIEYPEAWGRTTCHEIHSGHLHRRKTSVTYAVAEDVGGTVVRSLPTASGTDDWHHKKGFIGSVKCVDAFLYCYKRGFIGHFTANANKED